MEELSGEIRYRMLETVRQFAHKKLQASGEQEPVQARHLKFHVELAETFEVEFTGPRQVAWLHKLESDVDNVRAAIAWSMTVRDVHAGLRLAAALREFWLLRHIGEGIEHVRAVLALKESAGTPAERARALACAGYLLTFQGNPAQAWTALAEARTLALEAGDAVTSARCLIWLGEAAHRAGDYDTALRCASEGLAQLRAVDDQYQVGCALYDLGDMALRRNNYAQAQAFYAESAIVLRPRGEQLNVAISLRRLGQVSLERGDWRKAAASVLESLSLNVKGADKRGIAACVAALASIGAARGHAAEAVRICGAVSAILEAMQTHMLTYDQGQYERTLEIGRAELNAAVFDSVWTDGRRMTIEQAVQAARSAANLLLSADG